MEPKQHRYSKNIFIKYRKKSSGEIKSGLLRQTQDLELLKNIADKEIIKLNHQLIKVTEKQIKVIEDKILELIFSNDELKEQFDRMISIPGVGKVPATLMIIKTKGFSEVKSARKMACFAVVVPFGHRSGSSVYYKPRTSTMADKELKKYCI